MANKTTKNDWRLFKRTTAYDRSQCPESKRVPFRAQADGVGGETNLSPAPSLEYFSGPTRSEERRGGTDSTSPAAPYPVRANLSGKDKSNTCTSTRPITTKPSNSSSSTTSAMPQTAY